MKLPRHVKHVPNQPAMQQKLWNTICFNFAEIAASAYEGIKLNVDGTELMPNKS